MNKLKNKRILLLIIGGILILLIVVVILINVLSRSGVIGGVSNPDAKKFEDEYEELNGMVSEDGRTYPEVNISSDNLMKYSNASEILSIFENKGDAAIYFGYSTCLYCRSAVQVLCDAAASTDLDTIYYLDIEEKDDKYDELIEIMDDKFIVTEDEDKKIYAPLVVFVVNGDIVSYNKGTLFSQDDPYVELDDSQVEGLSEIYGYGINDVLNGMKDNY